MCNDSLELAGNTKEVNYEKLYVMYIYICVYAC